MARVIRLGGYRVIVALAAVMAMGASQVHGAARAAPVKDSPQVTLKEWSLENGLRVIFASRQQVPAVTVQVWYHVGSKNERPGIRGMAHLFEHMMFKGSERVPPEQHARLISSIGGSNNAFTAEDVTAYHNTVPRQYLDFAMQLEAERMRNLHLTGYTIQSEREVVKEEKRMRMENSPIGRALEAIHALAYVQHPYAWTPAGSIEDLNQVTVEMCRKFYRTYYVPNNATLVVAGDVTEEQVRAAAERQFGSIPRGPDPVPVSIIEPPQTAMRVKNADWSSRLGVVLGAYHAPDARSDDEPALEVASAVLSAGQSSRLNQALVRRAKTAVAAGGFLKSQEHPGLFFIYAVGLPSHDLQTMRKGLLDEVDRLARAGVTAPELLKAKNQLATSALTQLRTIDGLANQIGMSVYLYHNPRAFLERAARFDRVSAADVQRVAQRYLRQENLSLVVLGAAGQGQEGAGR